MDGALNLLHYPNMKHIPIYALYGEADGARGPDWLHWETIPARSGRHGFRIAPHRHEQFFQLLALTAGTARVTLDGDGFTLTPPALVLVPALVVHGYEFSPDVDGLVLTLMARELTALGLAFAEPAILRGRLAAVETALEQLIAEAEQPAGGHDLAMRAHLTLLLVALHRARREGLAGRGRADRARQHAERFRALVDTRFRQTRRIADYAAELGISATHLNRICRQVLGLSALAVIERRLALEARRQLLFSTLSIKQIGVDLGYDDPAYFTRVVTRVLGAPPRRFRAKGSPADNLGPAAAPQPALSA